MSSSISQIPLGHKFGARSDLWGGEGRQGGDGWEDVSHSKDAVQSTRAIAPVITDTLGATILCPYWRESVLSGCEKKILENLFTGKGLRVQSKLR